MKIGIDDAICLVIVRRKPDPVTDKDAFFVLTPTSAQDAMRIQKVLTEAQKTLIDLTARAVIDGVKQAEKLK